MGLLARSLDYFDSPNLYCVKSFMPLQTHPWTNTNRGLEMNAHLLTIPNFSLAQAQCPTLRFYAPVQEQLQVIPLRCGAYGPVLSHKALGVRKSDFGRDYTSRPPQSLIKSNFTIPKANFKPHHAVKPS
jgi:hypothetical protein